MNDLYIIIPAYNEEENIENTINDWYPVAEKFGGKLVIINDGSKDNTYDIICRQVQNKPLLIPLNKSNSGHGATILFGYNYAIKNNAEYIFQTDSDGQTLPEEFCKFWELRDSYDMIIGHRNNRKDGISRVFVTKVLKAVIKLSFGVNVTDANTPFRLMNAQTLKKYIGLIPEDFNLSNVIISVIYAKKNLNVKYIPITFKPRQGGINSINLKRIFKIGLKALHDFKKINKIISR